MIDLPAASRRLQRVRELMNLSPLPEPRVIPPTVRQVEASDVQPLPMGVTPLRGSAVEASRSATNPRDECDCAVCSSDLAGIAPCLFEEEEK